MHHRSNETTESTARPSVQAGMERKMPPEPPHRENRLAKETSPYLLLHKRNPVDWYPWCKEAFRRAKAEDKPIFLSIGYSSCYWCHVMERESFSNPRIAAFLNKHFVCIKVDREELPDVDALYMTAVHLMGLRGGWPLSVFLTPEGKPFFGGTYWPPEDRGGAVGFRRVLEQVVSAWHQRRDDLEQFASRVADGLRQAVAPSEPEDDSPLDQRILARAVDQLRRQFDPEYGGFGYHPSQPALPKFPQPPKLALLLYHAQQADDPASLETVTKTLDHMARGGIWDHLGGGFHRYSTDRFWRVPHFEKMLYDNALLARVYLKAFEVTGRARYRQVVEGICGFVAREMTSPDGAFYSALDAESEHEEGRYYVWTRREVQAILGEDDYRVFASLYGLDKAPNFEGGRYVLCQSEPIEQSATAGAMSPEDLLDRVRPMRDALLQARYQRPRPLRDTKILADWNGLMIAALADAYRVLGDDAYRRAAEGAARFILDRMRDGTGRLQHSYSGGQARIPGYLSDYACFADALLALHEATGEDRWLREAQTLADQMVRLFWDPVAGGFFTTSPEHDALLARIKAAEDSVMPSGNSVAVEVLVSLAERTGDVRYARLASRTLATFRGPIAANPAEYAAMITGLGRFLDVGFSVEASPANRMGPDIVTARMKLSAQQLRPGERFQVVVELEIADGWHVNAHPASDERLMPVTVALDSPGGLEDVRIEYPQGDPFTVEGMAEPIAVYTGRIAIVVKAALADGVPSGDSTINAVIRYQACDATRCLEPQTIELALPVQVTHDAGATEPGPHLP